MKTILFNGENKPQAGEIYLVKKVYPIHDGCYGPMTAVILEPISLQAGLQLDLEKFDYAKKYIIEGTK